MFNNDDEQVDYGNSLYSKVDPKLSSQKFSSAHQILTTLPTTTSPPLKKKWQSPKRKVKDYLPATFFFEGDMYIH